MFSRFIFLRVLGWKIEGCFPVHEKKLIVVTAPHTSMMDFVIGWFYYRFHGLKTNFLIKKELFFFPLGLLLKSMGSIPVQRGKVSLVDQMVMEFDRRERIILNITPEGTRNRVTKWKRGFYKIAERTNTPVVLGYIDYKRKAMGIFPDTYLTITGNIEQDMQKLKRYYTDVTPRHPDRFTTS
ncbi:MAG: 1-acyl-sn-glycerol-3-phosphate acyltransferase [Bacteroidetes bacterium]|nr:1-acyl-sn-glycerol-3-phosphate acyltransferase [Bacteroidota bacterium]